MKEIAIQKTPIPGMWPSSTDIFGDGPSTPLIRAISVMLAAKASTPEVMRFREEHLPQGKLLRATEVDTWIKGQPEMKHQPVKWLCNIPFGRLETIENGDYVIPKNLIERAKQIGEVGRLDPYYDVDPRMDTRLFTYATPECERAREFICEYGGVLDKLHRIVYHLLWFQGSLWQEAQAATFILTGYIPLVPKEAFPLPSRPGRRQTEKHLQLAVFTAQKDADSAPLNTRLVDWNRRFPHWAYKQATTFGGDSRQAQRRLMSLIPSPRPVLIENEEEVAAVESIELGYTGAEVAAAIAEKRLQQGGKMGPMWSSEIPRLLIDAKQRRRREAEG